MADSKKLKKILYVEDEADIQAIAQIALESVGGYTLMACSSGEEAIDSITGFNPDLILLDVMMPGMDGPSTLRALHNLPGFESTPAIFMTAQTLPEEIEVLLKEGVLDIITKPFDPMELAKQIQKIWDSA